MEPLRSFNPSVFSDNSTIFVKNQHAESAENSTFVRKWWKEAVVYHIYPRSFCDSNGDGIGDLKGITSKLDYIQSLGVNVVWLGPVYESPNEDNGYDISDYYKIMSDFGTMEDWEELISEMHKRGIKLCMDLVLNHTSSDHEWFKKSRQSKNNPYRDYYIWRPPTNGKEPNNWVSFFGGPAWKLDELTGEYYLHLFAPGQPDLNWENPVVREQVQKLIHFWLEKGVDAFRMDVINVISKVEGLPNCQDPSNPQPGSQFYFNGPKLVEYLREIKEKLFDHYNIFTVGETPCVTPEHGKKYTHHSEGVLSMLFHFEHMEIDMKKSKWDCKGWELSDLKRVMSRWQTELSDGWQSLYLENHDQPRSLSRFGDDKKYRVESAKMLATWLHMFCGTPYVYQGQEIGMINAHYDIEDYRDVETLNMYREYVAKGEKSMDEIMNAVHTKSRDNTRTPMQWNSSPNAGFTSGTPWLKVNPSYPSINVENAVQDPHSILHHYKKIIQLRKDYPIIVYGTYEIVVPEHPQVFAYRRKLGKEQLLVIANFYGEQAAFTLLDQHCLDSWTKKLLLVSNYDDVTNQSDHTTIALRPYEIRVFWFTR